VADALDAARSPFPLVDARTTRIGRLPRPLTVVALFEHDAERGSLRPAGTDVVDAVAGITLV
jgi:hypothetical protein